MIKEKIVVYGLTAFAPRPIFLRIMQSFCKSIEKNDTIDGAEKFGQGASEASV